MAALLKKRALAEFSQVIQEEPKPPIKRLKLTHVPSQPPDEIPINLKDCTTPAEILDQLFRLESSLPLTSEVAAAVISQIKAYFYPEQDEGIRSCIVLLLGKLGKLPNVDSSYICDDLINWAKNEKSRKLLGQILLSLMEIGKSLPYDSALHLKLVTLSVKHLRDPSHLVRCKCLDMIGCLSSPDHQLPVRPDQSKETGTMQNLIVTFTNDNDPRVRSQAFRVMLTWHERGLPIDKSAYGQTCGALCDDYEGVRLCAVRLVWVLCQLHSESLVKVSDTGTEEIRLIDDGFAKICNMVNDISMTVRAMAAGLLGSIHNVSPRFLEQTLDKKLMSNMRRKTSAHQRQKEHYESGEWSTGQTWADDAPKEDVDPDSVSVMASGACGAFVHGLEDEFLEVRHAAIDSICELSTQAPMFSILSQDFLVDMLNDEIDTIRLNAINSLQKMSQHIVLREDQVDSMLGVLKDYSYDVRDSLRAMFSCVKLGTKACLNTCVLALLDNLRRYPTDRESIWSCMKSLGQNHSFLVMSMAPDLLSSHPYFESHEPDVDDPAYIGILLLVFNATEQCPTMMALFPEHANRHYNYLRDTLPQLVPSLQLSPESQNVPLPDSMDSPSTSNRADFLSTTLSRLQPLVSMDTSSAIQLMDIGIRDLHCVRDIDPQLTATAKCHGMFLQCHRLLLKMIRYYKEGGTVALRGLEDTVLGTNIQQVYKLTNDLEHSFLGLGTAERLQVKQLRLRAQTIQLLLQLQCAAGSSKGACVDYIQILNTLQRHCTQAGVDPDPFSQSILSEVHRLESCEIPTFLPVLEAALDHHRCELLRLEGQVQRASATVTEPGRQSDKALRFIAGLTMAVDLIANVDNVEKTQDICIRVLYPDQVVEYMSPKPIDFRQLGPLRHRLVTKVLISHSKWSEPCTVELCVVHRYKAGHVIRGRSDTASSCSSSSNTVAYIELSKPVKVMVSPSGEKR